MANEPGESSAGCCPKFDPAPWQEKTFVWEDKPFIKEAIWQLFHMPLPWTVNRSIGRMWSKAQAAGAAPELKDFLMLAYDPSPWRSEFYLAVTGDVPGAENIRLSGTFLTKAFDGPFSAVPQWIREMDRYLASNGEIAKKHYFYFTTCPKCARVYGHNYVVAFAQVN